MNLDGILSISWLVLDTLYFQDNLSFPLICADWNADEEILLLEVLLGWIASLIFYFSLTFLAVVLIIVSFSREKRWKLEKFPPKYFSFASFFSCCSFSNHSLLCSCTFPFNFWRVIVLSTYLFTAGDWNVWIRKLGWSCRTCWNKK